jgi:hypothetical protein
VWEHLICDSGVGAHAWLVAERRFLGPPLPVVVGGGGGGTDVCGAAGAVRLITALSPLGRHVRAVLLVSAVRLLASAVALGQRCSQ